MKTTAILTSGALSLTLLLSACSSTPQTSPAANAPITPNATQALAAVSENLPIAPLPKGPRPQPVASSSPNLALSRQTFNPGFTLNPDGVAELIYGGSFGSSDGPIIAPSSYMSPMASSQPYPIATSDISVVERSTFNGKVFDTSRMPVNGATVLARSLNSSVPFEATTTTTNGAFAFNNSPSGVQIEIIVSVPGQPAQRRVEVIKSNKEGNPNANRYDFGTDGSDSTFGNSAQAIGQPGNLPDPNASPTPTPTPIPTPVPTPTPEIQAGQLTAGTWRDLDNWNDWLSLIQKAEWSKILAYWGLAPIHRIGLKLSDNERPVVDLALALKDADGKIIAKARSDSRGQAEFFPGLTSAQTGPFQLVSEADDLLIANLLPKATPVELKLKDTATASNNLDLMLMMDTTGSMADELDYLKAELHNVFQTIRQEQTQLQLRASMNFYRDQGDEYVVRSFPFNSDLNQTQQQLMSQTATGGGDYPEAVVEALENGLQKHDWSKNARTRLMFFVLDAPPHYQPAELAKLHALIPVAQELGVRIIPIASSGIDKQSEFLLRMLAITTGGEYVFLTNHSGIGGSHIEPTIGEHKVEKLNTLLLSLIRKYS